MRNDVEVSGNTATILAPAKLNLYLEVLGKRSDGYHEIITVMQAIDLFDSITLTRRPGEIGLRCDSDEIPQGRDNIAWRAAEAALERFNAGDGVEISIGKRIPVGRGLGGGSSDAAAVILAISRLLGTGLQEEAMRQIAASVGSDVPFFLEGGTALCRGRGEKVEPLNSALKAGFVVISPPISVSTRTAYESGGFAERPASILTQAEERCSILSAGLQRGDFTAVAGMLYNGFAETVFDLFPQLSAVHNNLTGQLGAATLTGTGSALYCLCESPGQAHAKAGRVYGSSGDVYVARALSNTGPGG